MPLNPDVLRSLGGMQPSGVGGIPSVASGGLNPDIVKMLMPPQEEQRPSVPAGPAPGELWKNRPPGEEGYYSPPPESTIGNIADFLGSFVLPEAVRHPIKSYEEVKAGITDPTDLLMDAMLYAGGGGLTARLTNAPKMVSRIPKGIFGKPLDPLRNEAGHIPGMEGLTAIKNKMGDAAWDALAPVRTRVLETNLLREGKLSNWLGGRNLGELILPASARMDRMTAGAFRKAEVGKAMASSTVERKIVPLLKSTTPEERIDLLKFMKTGDIPEGATIEAQHGMALMENYMGKMLNRPNLGYKPAYQNILEKTFNDKLVKTLDFDEPALQIIKESLKGQPKNFRSGQKALKEVIENPTLSVQAREEAIKLFDFPATLPREMFESYKGATNAVLHQKVLSSRVMSSAKPKEGFVASKYVKGPGKATAWVKKEVEQGLDELHYIREGARNFFNKYFTSPWKMAKVVLRMPTQFRNIIGNVILNDLQGAHPLPLYRPDVYARAARDLMKGTGDVKLFRELTGLDTSTFVGSELGKFFLPKTYDYNMLDNVLHAFMANPISRNMANFYQFNEKWAKYAKFMYNREKGMGDLDAALDAVRATFDYNDVSIFTRKMRETALPFFTWKAKVFGQLPEAFVKHPIRVSKYLALPAAMTSYAMDKLDVSEEEWDEVKGILPEYYRHGQLMLMPFRDEQERLQFMNLSWLLPGIGDITELSSGGLDPRGLMQNPLVHLSADLLANQNNMTKQPIWHEWESPAMKFVRGLYYPIKQLTPGWMPGGSDWNQIWKSVVNEEPDAMSPSAALISQFGIRMSPVNIESLYRRQSAIRKLHLGEMQKEMYRELQKTTDAEKQERIVEKYNKYIQGYVEDIEEEESEE